ncbi:X-linked retinitis pigmentosa GTPase regulator-like isoform X1 [Leucoraja erinacea]|uniref:X-linked retinitis pigmentosa GTPase regulator-like isoform X1 n=1 Tax=Leucoraja erinaceus TaxID=7782 RepID=UPI002456B3FA|nr:X-linked retinitis pigmentosa GTPase regulator-like isoform X1 [Leucoraja erinacea]
MAAESEADGADVPDSGAVFTFGKSKFSDNVPSKFWLKSDIAVTISCGDEHTALITENGKLYIFGSNNWGQLGLGTKNTMNKPTCVKALKSERVKLAACGRNHTLIWTEQGNIYATGDNSEGQLGLGDNQERTTFQRVEYFTGKGKIKQLAAGSNISAALTEDGNLFMWGDNSEGQIGLGSETSAFLPRQVNVGKTVSWVSCGYYHSALVTGEGELYTFGESDNGKLGLPLGETINNRIPQPVNNISGKVKQVACGGGHTLILTEQDVYAFGFGQFGQLGHGTSVFESTLPKVVEDLKKKKIRFISCGENHSAVVTDNGLLYTFGDGRHGKLGLGEENFTNQFKPTLCTRFLKLAVQSVACGGCHMLVLAIPRPSGSENIVIESDDKNKNYLTDTYTMTMGDSFTTNTLNRSLSARIRRRERERSPEQFGQMVRTLPPIGTGIITPSLPASSNTIPGEKIIEKKIIVPKPIINVQVYEKSPMSNINKEVKDAQKSLAEAESEEEESDKGLGETIDPLNMTHTVMVNPNDKTLTLSPVLKEQMEEIQNDENEEVVYVVKEKNNKSEDDEEERNIHEVDDSEETASIVQAVDEKENDVSEQVTSINKDQLESEEDEQDLKKKENVKISAENEDAQRFGENEDSESSELDECSESLEENEDSGSLGENEDADSVGEIEDLQNSGEKRDTEKSGANEDTQISGKNKDTKISEDNGNSKISEENEGEDSKILEKKEEIDYAKQNKNPKGSEEMKTLKESRSNDLFIRTKKLTFFKRISTKETEGKIQWRKTKSEESTKENSDGHEKNLNCSAEGTGDTISSDQNTTKAIQSNFKSKYKSATCVLV